MCPRVSLGIYSAAAQLFEPGDAQHAAASVVW